MTILLATARLFRRRVPVVLQLGAFDCGPSCLAMILGYHRQRIDPAEVRARIGGERGGASMLALVEAARAESQRMIESAKAQLEADVRRAREDLRREVGALDVTVAERLIRKSLREEDHRRIVDEAIAHIARS